MLKGRGDAGLTDAQHQVHPLIGNHQKGRSVLHSLAAMLLQRAASPHLFPGDLVQTEKTELMLHFFPFLSLRIMNWFPTML